MSGGGGGRVVLTDSIRRLRLSVGYKVSVVLGTKFTFCLLTG